ncbi:MAG: CapA family protein [Lachnospiraceae bacterium]|nr:CapA family protein [Lachnospiraceae bacterium]
MKKRKKKKKQIAYFLITFMAVLFIGSIALFAMSRRNAAGEDNQEVAESVENESAEELTLTEPQIAPDEDITTEVAPVVEDEVVQISPVVMAFGGDICFHDDFANMGALRSRGGKIDSSLSADLLTEMKQADILMVNNEFTYSDRGAPLPEKAFTFRSRPENVNLLHEMGVDIVSLANNHVYDYGEDALFDTLDILHEADIPYVGAGRNLDEAKAPYYYKINGRTIAFVSATQVERNESPDTRGATEVTAGTFRCFTEEEFATLLEVVEEADANSDCTVVYIHWGTENVDELHWAQEWQAPQLVEAGADMIVGDHPHCLQGIDYINGVPVFYSLGNFWFNSKTLDTGLLKVTLDENGTLICQFLPAKQHDCRTDLETGEEKQRILQYLQCISPDVTIDENGYITDVPYSGPEINYDAVSRLPKPVEEPKEIEPITDEGQVDVQNEGE